MISMDERFMAIAIQEAYKAKRINEVPIGAVVVINNKIIARGYNRMQQSYRAMQQGRPIVTSRAF